MHEDTCLRKLQHRGQLHKHEEEWLLPGKALSAHQCQPNQFGSQQAGFLRRLRLRAPMAAPTWVALLLNQELAAVITAMRQNVKWALVPNRYLVRKLATLLYKCLIAFPAAPAT